MSYNGYEKDIEKRPEDVGGVPSYMKEEDGAVPGESFDVGNSWYAKLQRIAGKYGVEQRGIERVPEYERTDHHGLLNVGTMVRIPILLAMAGFHQDR